MKGSILAIACPLQLPDRATFPEAALAVTRLRLTAFRCYAQAALDVDPRPVVLTGPNGAGKTNLLEALSFLAPGRGLRRARLAELDRRTPAGLRGQGASGTGWAVAATVTTPDGPVEIGTGRDAARDGSERRLVRLNGAPAKSQAMLADYVSAVWLTPEMDRLFVESASGRRRFLDRLVYGFDPAHAGRVAGYEQALRERARLLRDGRPNADPAWLGALETTMAERGVAIAAARREMAARLDRACGESAGPFPQATVAAAGQVEGWLDALPAVEAEARLQQMLAESRRQDAESGGAAIGPHRSDLAVHHAAKDMPAALCSTGEQKALLISIVLADARLRAAERGAPPILLLDEIAAHLDAARRAALFEEICALGAQAWLTGTDRVLFAGLEGRAQFVTVENAAFGLQPVTAGS